MVVTALLSLIRSLVSKKETTRNRNTGRHIIVRDQARETRKHVLKKIDLDAEKPGRFPSSTYKFYPFDSQIDHLWL